jgi:membrane protease YdiL (CAAX protease family)
VVYCLVCEEIAHRGMLFNGLSSLGTKNAIIYSSILFGLMHLNISQFFYAAIIGAILAVLTIASGSIIPAMIVHFLNNFINVVISYVDAKYYPDSSFSYIKVCYSDGFIYFDSFGMILLFSNIVPCLSNKKYLKCRFVRA